MLHILKPPGVGLFALDKSCRSTGSGKEVAIQPMVGGLNI
jgi:hypothetical protein